MIGDYLTIGEVADKLGMSYHAVYFRYKKGQFKRIDQLGDTLLIHQDEIERFKKNKKGK